MKALAILAIAGLVFLEWNCAAVSHHNPFSNWSTYETGVGFVESPMECTYRLTMADVTRLEWGDSLKNRNTNQEAQA